MGHLQGKLGPCQSGCAGPAGQGTIWTVAAAALFAALEDSPISPDEPFQVAFHETAVTGYYGAAVVETSLDVRAEDRALGFNEGFSARRHLLVYRAAPVKPYERGL